MTSGSHELLVEGRPVWMSSINYRCAIDGGLVPCNSVHWHGTKTGRSFYFFYLAGYRCFFFLFSTKKKKGKSSQEVHPSWAAAKKADFRFGHTFVSASNVTRQRIQLNRHSAHRLLRPTRNFFPNRQYEWNTTRSSISPPVAVFDFVLNRLSKSCSNISLGFIKSHVWLVKFAFSSTQFELKLKIKNPILAWSNFIQTIDDKATIS